MLPVVITMKYKKKKILHVIMIIFKVSLDCLHLKFKFMQIYEVCKTKKYRIVWPNAFLP